MNTISPRKLHHRTRRRLAAYHQAGHAVAMILKGLSFPYLTAVDWPAEDEAWFLEGVEIEPHQIYHRPECCFSAVEMDLNMCAGPFGVLDVAMAGRVAAAKAGCPLPDREFSLCSIDELHHPDLFATYCGDASEADRDRIRQGYIAAAENAAHVILSGARWQACVKIANRLQRSRVLLYVEAAHIYHKCIHASGKDLK